MKISVFLNRENNNLDLIRILLASLVIVGHSPILNGESAHWFDPIGNYFSFTYSGALAVKLFFFISGLVVTNSLMVNKSPAHFLISRIFRLIPALFFMLFITVFLLGPILSSLNLKDYFSEVENLNYLKNNLFFETDYFIKGLFEKNVYSNVVNGSLWSLRYEVGCYIALFGFFLLLVNRNIKYANIPIILIFIDTFLPHRILFSWLGENPEFYLLPISFAYGAFLAINADKIKINLGIVVGSFLIYYMFNKNYFAQALFIIACCNAAIYLSSLPVVLKLKPKYDISYGIYLWGFLVQQCVYHFIGHVYVGIHCFIALVISIIFALISFVLIEKPFMKLGKMSLNLIKTKFSYIK